MAVEKRPLIVSSDTLFLKLRNTAVRNYQFEINALNFSTATLSAFLEDNYSGTSIPISLSTTSTVDFAVTADIASANPDRFRIIFRTGNVLPVNYTSVKAYQQNAGVQVEWNVATESNIRSYEVEKSADARTFAKAAMVSPKANNSGAVNYGWFDPNPVQGLNYYRIKAIDNAGTAKYTQVVTVKLGGGKSELLLYPNPVVGNIINVQFINEPGGIYNVELINSLGQVMFAKVVEHKGGSATQTISLDNSVTKGVYHVHVYNDESKMIQKIVIN
jgi:hypothetical protein